MGPTIKHWEFCPPYSDCATVLTVARKHPKCLEMTLWRRAITQQASFFFFGRLLVWVSSRRDPCNLSSLSPFSSLTRSPSDALPTPSRVLICGGCILFEKINEAQSPVFLCQSTERMIYATNFQASCVKHRRTSPFPAQQSIMVSERLPTTKCPKGTIITTTWGQSNNATQRMLLQGQLHRKNYLWEADRSW